ncbi:hypothetical protein IAQ61_007673 [Plenodomus lingam]|uniref:uncharacterized protein n=1 Tax=Leptosphaeria maculans TaxID=5022 RepID=UPI00331D3B1F|nr:hypothetical protein IAQ61_007673 [Plenodomus lingam]
MSNVDSGMYPISNWLVMQDHGDINGPGSGSKGAHRVGRCWSVVTAAAWMACREATTSALADSKAAIAGVQEG